MVWKQDLAKLKQSFREPGGPPPPPVKPKAKPVEVKDLHDEDAMFLAAMGGRASRPSAPAPAAPAPPPPPKEEAPASFEAELGDLKGLKPMGRNPVLEVPEQAPVAAPPEPAQAIVAPEPLPATPMRQTEPPQEVSSGGAVRIQLAAGMAVEVDATLDLRGHSAQDALGRLRDRVEDGAFLGWRTLHVTLGEDEALHAALMAFLAEAGRIGRYAQAPIPMGGAQAWVLYY